MFTRFCHISITLNLHEQKMQCSYNSSRSSPQPETPFLNVYISNVLKEYDTTVLNSTRSGSRFVVTAPNPAWARPNNFYKELPLLNLFSAAVALQVVVPTCPAREVPVTGPNSSPSPRVSRPTMSKARNKPL